MEGAPVPATAEDRGRAGWSNSVGEWNLRRGWGQADRFCPGRWMKTPGVRQLDSSGNADTVGVALNR